MDDDWLGSYRRIDGVEAALRRVSERMSRRITGGFRLEAELPLLRANFDGLHADFSEFFPQLRAHVNEAMETHERGS